MNSESTESSVTASIEELLRIERRRAEDEAAARRARQETERRAAEQARAEEEARRRYVEAQRAREAFIAAEQARAEREERASRAARDVAPDGPRAFPDVPAAPANVVYVRERGSALLIALALFALTWAGGTGLALHAAARMDDDRASARSSSAQASTRIDEIERAAHAEADALSEVQAKLDTLVSRGSVTPPVAMPAPAPPRAPRIHRIAPPIAPTAHCKQGDPICSDLP